MHLFKKLERHWKLEPTSITTDYEKGLRSALRSIYLSAIILGCWFHYSQAIRRKGSQIKGFFEMIQSNQAAKKLYQKLLCLPLIRSDAIKLAFDMFKVQANQFGGPFIIFIDYYENQWINTEGAISICLFLQSHRTNNLLESYNSDLNAKLQSHGNLYNFLLSIQSEETIKSREYLMVSKGAAQMYPPQRVETIERDTFILAVQKSFAEKKLDIVTFFDNIIKYVDLEKYGTDLLNKKDDAEDEDEENNAEDGTANSVPNNKCIVCLSAMRDTLVTPCDHLHFCYNCIHSMHTAKRKRKLTEKQNCPSCNHPITSYVRVHS